MFLPLGFRMASVSRWILHLSACAALAAAPAQDKNRWLWEVQAGNLSPSTSFGNAVGPAGSTRIGAEPAVGFGPRVSVDLYSWDNAALQLSAGFRVPSEMDTTFSGLNPRYKEQALAGALLRFTPRSSWEWGLGVDYRRDSLEMTGVGSTTKESLGRAWGRAMVRYTFEPRKSFIPFVGLEVAGPFSSGDNPDHNFFQVLGTGANPYPQGLVSKAPASESQTRGNFPNMQLALIGGLRFGSKSPAPVVAPPAPAPVEKH